MQAESSAPQEALLSVQRALSLALAQAQIHLKFQPICRLNDGGVLGVEVYVGWPQSDGRVLHLSPADFVAEASKNGLFLPLANWVLETACQQVVEWQREYGPLVLAFNVSQSQLHDPSFASQVRTICHAVQFPLALLELEVSERVLAQDLAGSLARVHALTVQGLHITLDGFGLNQNVVDSLSQLASRQVKLDRQLVKRAAYDDVVARSVAYTASLVHAHGMLLMADGVEVQAQCDVLGQLGVVFGQGMYFAPPLAADEVTVLLKQAVAPGLAEQRIHLARSYANPAVA